MEGGEAKEEESWKKAGRSSRAMCHFGLLYYLTTSNGLTYLRRIPVRFEETGGRGRGRRDLGLETTTICPEGKHNRHAFAKDVG